MNEIRCAVCNTSNPAGSVFCGSCGTQIGFEAGEDGENRRYAAQLAQLRREIERLTGRIDRLQADLAGREEQAPSATEPEEPVATTPEPAIEEETAGPDQQEEPAAPSEPEEAIQPQEPVSEPEPVMAASGTDEPETRTVYIQGRPFEVPAQQQPVGDSGELRLPLPSMPAVDWERVLGRNWLAIIGALTLALGIGFFLKLSFDNNWIGDTGRILLGLGAGATLLGLGEFTKRRAPIWSQAVTAGGAATIYMSIYASYVLYELIRPDAAFYALGGVVWLAGILAVRYDSRVIGFLGIIGAFIAPLLLGPELPDVRLVLPYIAVVDLGILGVASVRNWRWFTISGWIGSYGLFAAGYAQYPETDPLLFQAGLTAIFLIFVGATTLFHIKWKRVPGSLDMALVAVNATAYFALTTIVLGDAYFDWLWAIAAGMAVMYGLIALVAYTRPGAPPQVAMITLPIALIFLTVAVPLGLTGVWLTTAWAAQGAILIWSGFVLGRAPMRVFGLGVLALSVVHLLSFPPEVDAANFSIFANDRFGVFVFVTAAIYVAAYLYLRFRDSVHKLETEAMSGLMVVGSILTIVGLSLEAIFYYGFGSSNVVDWGLRQEATTLLLLTLTWVWALYAVGLLVVGLVLDKPLARWGGLGLLTVALVKLLLIDTFLALPDAEAYVLGFNPHFITYAMVLAPTAFVAYSFRRRIAASAKDLREVFRALVAALHVLAVWGLSLEAIHYFDAQALTGGSLLVNDQNALDSLYVTLTVIWALYAAALLSVGLARGMSLARWGGLALVGLAFAKLVLFDSFAILPTVETYVPVLNPKFLAFVIAAAPVAAIGYVYRDAIRNLAERELTAFRALLVATNVVAVWAITVEAVHFFAMREDRLFSERFDPSLFDNQSASILARERVEAMQAVDQVEALLLSLTVIWALYGAALLSAGLWKNLKLAQWGGLGLLGLAVGKIVLLDTFGLFPDAETYTLILNTHFAANVVTIAAIGVVAFAFRDRIRALPQREAAIMRWLPVVAGALVLWAMSLEAIHYFAVQEEILETEQASAMHLTLTVLWAIYGIGIIVVGFLRDESRIRLAGMGLLAVPVVKLFVFDVFLLEQIYRVAAFVTLGALLLATGLLYQRYSTELKGLLLGRRPEDE